MNKRREYSIGESQSLFFVGGNVTMTQPFQDTIPMDLTAIIPNVKHMLNREWYVLASDGTTDIRILDTFNRHCYVIPLAGRKVTQLTMNAFCEPIPDSAYEQLDSNLRRYNGTVECTFQCVLTDGSVWNHTYLRQQDKNNNSTIHTSIEKFESWFTVVSGLPPIQLLLTSSTNSYIPERPFFLQFHTMEHELGELTAFTDGVAQWRRVAHVEIPQDVDVVPPQDSVDGLFIALREGRVVQSSIQQQLFPVNILELNDIKQLVVKFLNIEHQDSLCFFAITGEGRLHIVMSSSKWLKRILPKDYFEFLWLDTAYTHAHRFRQVYVYTNTLVPIIVTETIDGMLLKIVDAGSEVQIPDQFMYRPAISTAIGSLPVQHSAVAFSQDAIYTLEADGAVYATSFRDGQRDLTVAASYQPVAISAGWNHLLVLHADGTVRELKVENTSAVENQHVVPNDLTSVIAISCGEWMSYALRSDGTVVAWGRNDQDQVAPANYLRDIKSIHGGRHHALFMMQNGNIHHIGSGANNDADTFPIVREHVTRLHSSDIRAVAILDDHRVVDVFDESVRTIATDSAVVDVVATRSLYGLLYRDGRVIILHRYTLIEDDDPLYIDPITLAGISAIHANGDVLACVGFDGRIWALRSEEQIGYNPQPITLSDTTRVMVWSGLATQPENYDADACHEANTLALQLDAIKQRHAYMNIPKPPII